MTNIVIFLYFEKRPAVPLKKSQTCSSLCQTAKSDTDVLVSLSGSQSQVSTMVSTPRIPSQRSQARLRPNVDQMASTSRDVGFGPEVSHIGIKCDKLLPC